MSWPDFYPQGCPYNDSAPAEGDVFRVLVFASEPGPEDFKSYRELHPNRRFHVPECEACGLSVYRELADVESMMRRVPRLRDRPVVRGRLNARHGLIASTPKQKEPSHCTWWIPCEVEEPWSAFELLQRTGG
jgi:hypothetical protein